VVESEKISSKQGVSIIVPCRNEVDYIDRFIESILAQTRNRDIEILIADGMSNDGTRERLLKLAATDERVKIVENPEKIVSTGLNRAIKLSSNEIIIRMDVHTEYADNYIEQCVKVLEDTGADNVGGAWCAKGRSFIQKAIALAFQSPFSSGAAASHKLDYEGVVDSVYLGCWKKSAFEKFGLFDVELIRNQDDELNLRISRMGGKIWQSPKIRSWYYPRSSLISLFKQYMQYGYWKVRVMQKHKLPASIRHLVPGAFVSTMLALILVALFSSLAGQLLMGLLVLYLSATVIASFITCKANWKYMIVMPLVFIAYHIGYGYGFNRGLLDFFVLKKGAGNKYVELTRKG